MWARVLLGCWGADDRWRARVKLGENEEDTVAGWVIETIKKRKEEAEAAEVEQEEEEGEATGK